MLNQQVQKLPVSIIIHHEILPKGAHHSKIHIRVAGKNRWIATSPLQTTDVIATCPWKNHETKIKACSPEEEATEIIYAGLVLFIWPFPSKSFIRCFLPFLHLQYPFFNAIFSNQSNNSYILLLSVLMNTVYCLFLSR
jgi:hypothetical protein